MQLEIEWNDLYSSNPEDLEFARRQILYHYKRRKLAWIGINRVEMRLAFLFFTSNFAYFFRNTGWHGESGAATSCGHLNTGDFWFAHGGFYSTHHIYYSNRANSNRARYRRSKWILFLI